MTVAVTGCGTLGASLVRGWLAAGAVAAADVHGTARRQGRQDPLDPGARDPGSDPGRQRARARLRHRLLSGAAACRSNGMAVYAPLSLQPQIERLLADADGPESAACLRDALATLLQAHLQQAPPDQHGAVVHDLIAALRTDVSLVSPATGAALPVLLAAADAVRLAIAASEMPAPAQDSARLPQTALELAAQGAIEQLARAERVITECAQTDGAAAHVARLRFYAGLDLQQIALVLDMSSTNVRRAWNRVRSQMRQ